MGESALKLRECQVSLTNGRIEHLLVQNVGDRPLSAVKVCHCPKSAHHAKSQIVVLQSDITPMQ